MEEVAAGQDEEEEEEDDDALLFVPVVEAEPDASTASGDGHCFNDVEWDDDGESGDGDDAASTSAAKAPKTLPSCVHRKRPNDGSNGNEGSNDGSGAEAGLVSEYLNVPLAPDGTIFVPANGDLRTRKVRSRKGNAADAKRKAAHARLRREWAKHMHLLHVLCYLGHGMHACRLSLLQEVQCTALSCMPPHLLSACAWDDPAHPDASPSLLAQLGAWWASFFATEPPSTRDPAAAAVDVAAAAPGASIESALDVDACTAVPVVALNIGGGVDGLSAWRDPTSSQAGARAATGLMAGHLLRALAPDARQGSSRLSALLLVCVLRALGLEARYVVSLRQSIPFKAPTKSQQSARAAFLKRSASNGSGSGETIRQAVLSGSAGRRLRRKSGTRSGAGARGKRSRSSSKTRGAKEHRKAGGDTGDDAGSKDHGDDGEDDDPAGSLSMPPGMANRWAKSLARGGASKRRRREPDVQQDASMVSTRRRRNTASRDSDTDDDDDIHRSDATASGSKRRRRRGSATSSTPPRSVRRSRRKKAPKADDAVATQAEDSRKKGRRRSVGEADDVEEASTDAVPRVEAWVEVFCAGLRRWLPMHPATGHVLVKPEDAKLMDRVPGWPLNYVLAFDAVTRRYQGYEGDTLEEDEVAEAERDTSVYLTVTPVTERYAARWSESRKVMMADDWWSEVLQDVEHVWPLQRKHASPFWAKMHELEGKQLIEARNAEPMPTALNGFRSHPAFCIEKLLGARDCIHPTRHTIVGEFRGHAVYTRDSMYRLKAAEKWIQEGKSVCLGAVPVKRVRSKGKQVPLYGEWQVEDYRPPVAHDGIVPKNEFGNVYLFKREMLPIGCVYLELPGLTLRMCKQLGIDACRAVTAWCYKQHGTYPELSGIVVCAEYEDVLRDAYVEKMRLKAKRDAAKRAKRALSNWRKLMQKLRIRRRLQAEYGDTVATGMAQSTTREEPVGGEEDHVDHGT